MVRGKSTVMFFPLVLGLLLAAAQQLEATILRVVPLEDQARAAELVVVAVAGEQSCAWGDGQRVIYTDTRFRVEQWVKGSGGGEVTARRIGGVIGDIGQSVAGSPEFKTGGRYVLFLESSGAGSYRVVGFSQGAYPVLRSFWGRGRVMPSLAAESGVEMIGAPGGKGLQAQPLEDFLEKVRSILGEGGIGNGK